MRRQLMNGGRNDYLSRLRGRSARSAGCGLSPLEQCDSRKHPHPSPPPQERERERSYCASALYLVSEALSSASAASGSPPFFLTPSPQVLTSGSAAFFHAAVCSGVSL